MSSVFERVSRATGTTGAASKDSPVFQKGKEIMKSRAICAALIAALSLVSVSAQASWVQVNEMMAYNTERIETNGPIRTAFIRINSGGKVMGKHYDYAISRKVYNCRDWTSASKADAAYKSDGTSVVARTYQSYEMVFDPIMPDSYGEDTAKAICEN
ncbi:hypothetical protein [Paraburkholderia sp. J11-2]|uniref:hypothetical protein n=1 Tax=Paraburkholderia sp. J11-2 TaxID=2805431 RepID=UPI002AB62316|nr:hypothetical protein [Paraburkholderia sp. J11-2]